MVLVFCDHVAIILELADWGQERDRGVGVLAVRAGACIWKEANESQGG